MSTFERVRTNILKDMAGVKVHTPESWANILLTNTNQLRNEKEQAKFWAWMANPDERDEVEPPTLKPIGKNEDVPPRVTVSVQDECDEKEGTTEIELQNDLSRNGFITVCRTRPV